MEDNTWHQVGRVQDPVMSCTSLPQRIVAPDVSDAKVDMPTSDLSGEVCFPLATKFLQQAGAKPTLPFSPAPSSYQSMSLQEALCMCRNSKLYSKIPM